MRRWRRWCRRCSTIRVYRLELTPSLLQRLSLLLVAALPALVGGWLVSHGQWPGWLLMALAPGCGWMLWQRPRATALWLSEARLTAIEWRGHYWPLAERCRVRRLGWLLWFDIELADQPPPRQAPQRVLLWRDALTTSQWRRACRLALALNGGWRTPP